MKSQPGFMFLYTSSQYLLTNFSSQIRIGRIGNPISTLSLPIDYDVMRFALIASNAGLQRTLPSAGCTGLPFGMVDKGFIR